MDASRASLNRIAMQRATPRWIETLERAGVKTLLVEAGFDADRITAWQWGNRAAAWRNRDGPWPPPFDPDTDDLIADLIDDPAVPVRSWALAQKQAVAMRAPSSSGLTRGSLAAGRSPLSRR